VLELVADTLNKKENKYSNFGAYASDELHNMSPTMAMYRQKLIADAIFEAKCGNLNRRSLIWSPGEMYEYNYSQPECEQETASNYFQTYQRQE
jgi:hypothetical protein